MTADARGETKRIQKWGLGALRALRLTGNESLAIATIEDRYADLCRSGRRFHGGLQILTNAIAPVTTVPQTTISLGLYNGDVNRSYVLDRVSFYLASGTPTAGATLFMGVFLPTTTANVYPPYSNATGYGSQSSSGSAYGTRALWFTSAAGFSSSGWVSVQATNTPAANNVGQGDMWADLEGRFIVPPGQCAGFQVLSGTGTTPLYGINCMWTEVELDLE